MNRKKKPFPDVDGPQALPSRRGLINIVSVVTKAPASSSIRGDTDLSTLYFYATIADYGRIASAKGQRIDFSERLSVCGGAVAICHLNEIVQVLCRQHMMPETPYSSSSSVNPSVPPPGRGVACSPDPERTHTHTHANLSVDYAASGYSERTVAARTAQHHKAGGPEAIRKPHRIPTASWPLGSKSFTRTERVATAGIPGLCCKPIDGPIDLQDRLVKMPSLVARRSCNVGGQ